MSTFQVIFLTFWPFNDRDAKRFDFRKLQSSYGFNFEYWDISPFLDIEFYENYKLSINNLSSIENYIVFKNKEDFIKKFYIKINNSNCLFILSDFICFERLWIYQLFFETNTQYCLLNLNSIPCSKQNIILGLIKYPLRIVRKMLTKQKEITTSLGNHGVKPPAFVVLGGDSPNLSNIKMVNKYNVPIIWSHSNDYDQYMSQAENSTHPLLPTKDYAVFLDDFLIHHPDFKLMKNLHSISEEKYYQELNQFITNLEQVLNIKIIIAAHPSSYYEKMENNPFINKTVIKNNTMNLTQNAKFVLTHYSTSISFAIISKIPIILMTSNEINKSKYIKRIINSFSNSLGLSPINISHKVDSNSIKRKLIVNYFIYEKYMKNFIRSSKSDEIQIVDALGIAIKKLVNINNL